MFGIGSGELLLIALFVLIIFGPDKLPEMARTFGKVMREFNRAKDTMESQIRAEMYATEKSLSGTSAEDGSEEPMMPTAIEGPIGPVVYDDTEDEEEEEV